MEEGGRIYESKMKNKTHSKQFSATKMMRVIILFIFFTVFLVGTVSAFELNPFADKKIFEEDITDDMSDFIKEDFNDEYGIIRLSKTFFWFETDRIAEYSLTDNTIQCTINCEAEGRAILYSDLKLFDGVGFVGGIVTNVQYWLKSYEPFEVNDYRIECLPSINLTGIYCEEVLTGSHLENKTIWNKYNFEVLNAGNYEWKLAGTKGYSDNVDFQIKVKEQVFTEWAFWNGTGGTVTFDGDFTIHTFTSNGTFEWIGDTRNVTYLVIAGGGSGGKAIGGGGGAGGYRTAENFTVTAQNYTITVGVGGASQTSSSTAGNNGGNSTFSTITSQGGGGGAAAGANPGGDGGSGGGGSETGAFGDGVAGQGFDGGTGGSNLHAGGGGGASEVGADRSGSIAGAGGDGLSSSINGTAVIRAGGGGGSTNGGTRGAGGAGGGGQGGDFPGDPAGANGVVNTGSGGGGSEGSGNSGAGGSGIVIIRYLTLPGLTITLNSPIEAFNSTNKTIDFNGTVTGVNGIVNVTLFIDGVLNETNSSAINDTDYLFSKVIADGDHNWTYESCDSNECTTATLRTFAIDTNIPIVSVTSPTGDQGTFVSGINLTLDWTVIDPNPDTCIYEYDGINTTVTCSANTTNFTVTDSSKISLIFYANDTFGNANFNTTNWSYSFIENNVTFNENVSETSSQFFEINLSTGLSVLSISANLNYDETNYFSTSACGDFCLVNNTIDIPLVPTGESELKSFFWDINIFNGTDSINVNTTTRTQNVSRVHLETCDATFTVQSLNFTAYNEQNLSRISPFTFDGTFDIWLGSGDVKRNNSFSDSSIVEKTLCIFPNATYFVDAEIQYNEAANTTFITRDYYFQNDTISNVSQDIFLYLLSSSVSTSFILKVQDTNLLPLENHLIIIQRFYPGENLFRTVQIAKTGANGKTVGFFETETVDYRFIIKRNGRTLLTTTQQKIVGEVAPFTITFTLGVDLGKPWETLENLTDFQYSLGFDQSTNIVTYTYTDTSGNFTLGTLVVERQNFSFATNTVLCNIDSSQSSATITCNITGNGTGTYVGKGFVTRGSIEILINQFNFIIESFSAVAGFLGVLLAWFLILISSFAFKFNEIAGIFMINATVIFVNIIGLVSFGMLAISALIGVSIIIAVVMEK